MKTRSQTKLEPTPSQPVEQPKIVKKVKETVYKTDRDVHTENFLKWMNGKSFELNIISNSYIIPGVKKHVFGENSKKCHLQELFKTVRCTPLFLNEFSADPVTFSKISLCIGMVSSVIKDIIHYSNLIYSDNYFRVKEFKKKYDNWNFNPKVLAQTWAIENFEWCINKSIEDYCERKRKIEALAEHETYIDRRRIEHIKKLCEYRIEAICLLLKGMTVRINAMLTNICSDKAAAFDMLPQTTKTIVTRCVKIFRLELEGDVEYVREDVDEILKSDIRLHAWITEQSYRLIEKTTKVYGSPCECPVCFESINENCLSCGHYIHRDCLIKSKKTTCPMCKKEVEMSFSELERLYKVLHEVSP